MSGSIISSNRRITITFNLQLLTFNSSLKINKVKIVSNMSISRKRAVELLEQYIQNPRMRNHCYASEAVLRALASQLGEDEDKWGMAGLLHDLDVEVTNDDPKGLNDARQRKMTNDKKFHKIFLGGKHALQINGKSPFGLSWCD